MKFFLKGERLVHQIIISENNFVLNLRDHGPALTVHCLKVSALPGFWDIIQIPQVIYAAFSLFQYPWRDVGSQDPGIPGTFMSPEVVSDEHRQGIGLLPARTTGTPDAKVQVGEVFNYFRQNRGFYISETFA